MRCVLFPLLSLPNAKMVDEAGDRLFDPPGVAIIREVYDSENAYEAFEQDLDRALDAGCSMIIVEPTRLGDETARWITVGNCLHKTAVFSGVGAIATGLIWTEKPYAALCTPLGALSLLCTGIYTLSWQFDPCCQYQVERDVKKLAEKFPLSGLGTASPIVLVRKDNTRRKFLHTGVSLVAAVFCAWRLYDTYK